MKNSYGKTYGSPKGGQKKTAPKKTKSPSKRKSK